MEMNRIVLSGCAGSGKTTVGKALAERLGYNFLSAGELARKHAAEVGLTIQELQIRLAENSDYDRELDAYLTLWGMDNEGYVLDYRLGFHFLPGAFNVYLNVSPEVAAHRIALQNRISEFANVVEPAIIMADLTRRNEQMKNRFIALYNVDFTQTDHDDLVIETDRLSVIETVNVLAAHLNR
jgi:predicted cytidylate kinase